MSLPRPKRPSSGVTYSAFVFFLGLLTTKAFEVFIHDFSGEYDRIITVILFAFTVLAGVYYFDSIEKRIRVNIDTMDTTVRYVEETYNPNRKEEFTGRVYKELEEIVTSAKEEILQVGVFHEETYHTSTHPSRVSYFHALEERIKRAQDNHEVFTYMRIHQYPREKALSPIKDLFHDKSRAHLRNMVDRASNPDGGRVAVAMYKIERRILMPFRVIDGRTVILEIDTIASDGIPYASGIIIVSDRTKNGRGVASRFQDHFQEVRRHAYPIEPDDLE